MVTANDWRAFLERWNTEAMAMHIRFLRRVGLADPTPGGRRTALKNTATDVGIEIPESLFEPFGDGGSDSEVLAEAKQRLDDIDTLIMPSVRARWPHSLAQDAGPVGD